MAGLISRSTASSIASSTESAKSPRQKHRQTGSRYLDGELRMEMDELAYSQDILMKFREMNDNAYTQDILMKIRWIEKAAAAKSDIVGHIMTALEAICCGINGEGSSCTWFALYCFHMENLGHLHNQLLVAMSREDYSWGRSSIHAIASATSSLITKVVSAASGAKKKKIAVLIVYEALYMLAGVIFSKDGNDSFMEVNYIGGYVSSLIFLDEEQIRIADACAINNAVIDIINSRYILLQDGGPTNTESTESNFYTRLEISWAVGSAASRYRIPADTVFRILPESLTLKVSEALIEVFCQNPVILGCATPEVMKTISFVDATNNLTSELRSRIIENMLCPGWLPARYVLTPIVRTSTSRSETWSSCDVQTGKSIALFMDREQNYSHEKEDIKWSKLGVEKKIVFPVVVFNIIMVIILVAALYSAISYNDVFANAQIDVTSFLSLVVVFEGLAFAGFTAVYRENWSLYWMFQFKVHYNDISKILEHNGTTDIRILRGIVSNRRIYSKLIQPSRACWIGDGAVEADNYLSSDVHLWSYYECGVIELGTHTTDGGYRAVMVQIRGEMLNMEPIELSGFTSGQAHVTYDIDSGMGDVTLGFLQSQTWDMPIGATKESAGRSTIVSDARRFNAMDVASRVYNTIWPVTEQHGQHHGAQRSD